MKWVEFDGDLLTLLQVTQIDHPNVWKSEVKLKNVDEVWISVPETNLSNAGPLTLEQVNEIFDQVARLMLHLFDELLTWKITASDIGLVALDPPQVKVVFRANPLRYKSALFPLLCDELEKLSLHDEAARVRKQRPPLNETAKGELQTPPVLGEPLKMITDYDSVTGVCRVMREEKHPLSKYILALSSADDEPCYPLDEMKSRFLQLSADCQRNFDLIKDPAYQLAIQYFRGGPKPGLHDDFGEVLPRLSSIINYLWLPDRGKLPALGDEELEEMVRGWREFRWEEYSNDCYFRDYPLDDKSHMKVRKIVAKLTESFDVHEALTEAIENVTEEVGQQILDSASGPESVRGRIACRLEHVVKSEIENALIEAQDKIAKSMWSAVKRMKRKRED